MEIYASKKNRKGNISPSFSTRPFETVLRMGVTHSKYRDAKNTLNTQIYLHTSSFQDCFCIVPLNFKAFLCQIDQFLKIKYFRQCFTSHFPFYVHLTSFFTSLEFFCFFPSFSSLFPSFFFSFHPFPLFPLFTFSFEKLPKKSSLIVYVFRWFSWTRKLTGSSRRPRCTTSGTASKSFFES